jgi:hypothetical protein
MAGVVYTLCTLTALLCCVLLARGYQRSRNKLLLWGSLCFLGLTLNNALLAVDKLLTAPDITFFTWRLLIALAAMLILLFGLIWDFE